MLTMDARLRGEGSADRPDWCCSASLAEFPLTSQEAPDFVPIMIRKGDVKRHLVPVLSCS